MSCFTFDAAILQGFATPVADGSDVPVAAATVSVAEAVAQVSGCAGKLNVLV